MYNIILHLINSWLSNYWTMWILFWASAVRQTTGSCQNYCCGLFGDRLKTEKLPLRVKLLYPPSLINNKRENSCATIQQLSVCLYFSRFQRNTNQALPSYVSDIGNRSITAFRKQPKCPLGYHVSPITNFLSLWHAFQSKWILPNILPKYMQKQLTFSSRWHTYEATWLAWLEIHWEWRNQVCRLRCGSY